MTAEKRTPDPRQSRLFRRCALAFLRIASALLAASALGPVLRLDFVGPGMAFTYVPRVVLAIAAFALAALAFLRRRRGLGALNFAAGTLLLLTSGLGSWLRAGIPEPSGKVYHLIAFNTEDSFIDAPRLAEIARRHEADFLCLEEVNDLHRADFIASLSDYQFFWGDGGQPVHAYEDPRRRLFSCMTGVRKTLLAAEDPIELAGAITGYRTHAVRARLGGQDLWLVNVHGTKPTWVGGPWRNYLLKARWKAAWHREEHDLLAAWLAGRRSSAVVLAGDFNAPDLTYNTRFDGFRNAHYAAGSGLHLSFPRSLPLIGIDNVLGNKRVRFHEYRVFDAGFGDHRAQLCAFTILSDR